MKHTFLVFGRNYGAKLIELYLATTIRSIAANAIAVFLITFALIDSFNHFILFPWVFAQITYFVLRYLLYKKLSKILHTHYDKALKYLYATVILTFYGALLWAFLIIASVGYISFEQQLILLATMTGIIAGSLATLSAFFITFEVFIFTITAGIIIAFILVSTSISYIIIVLTLLFTLIVHASAHILFSHMKNSINLAIELESSQKELAKLNKSQAFIIEKEVTKNKEQMNHMLHQSRLALMGEMLSMIAHQWRQPLTAITTAVASVKFQSAFSETLDKKKLNKHLNDIENYALHLSTTINDFRSFFQTNQEEVKTSFMRIYQDTMKLIESSLVIHNISVELDIQSDIEIFSYPNELKHVLLNIIKNAEDILMSKEITDPTIKVTISHTNTQSLLCISDNAGGIPEDIIKNIFDPYFTTKLYSDGTGLGLYMSKTIVHEQCKGKLSVVNDDKGAVFTIAIMR